MNYHIAYLAIGATSLVITIGPLRRKQLWGWWSLITLLPVPPYGYVYPHVPGGQPDLIGLQASLLACFGNPGCIPGCNWLLLSPQGSITQFLHFCRKRNLNFLFLAKKHQRIRLILQFLLILAPLLPGFWIVCKKLPACRENQF